MSSHITNCHCDEEEAWERRTRNFKSNVCSPIQTIRFSWRWCQSLIQHNWYIVSDLRRDLFPLASRSESEWLGSSGSERCHKERSGLHESFKHGLSMISICVNQVTWTYIILFTCQITQLDTPLYHLVTVVFHNCLCEPIPVIYE